MWGVDLFVSCCFDSIYILGLVLQWVKDEGGVEKMEENSKLKSQAVYEAIQKSNRFYQYVYYDVILPVNILWRDFTSMYIMTWMHKKSTSPDII